MKQALISQALRIAREHLPHHPERKFRHYTFTVLDGQIISFGWNRRGTTPIWYGYNKLGRFPKIHSEVAAYWKGRHRLRGRFFSCINIRLNAKGEVRSSAPCACCRSFLQAVGCREIVVLGEER